MAVHAAPEKAHDPKSSYPIASLVKRVLRLFREILDEALRPYGLTSAQFYILAALGQEPCISGARLARTCQVTPQTTQVLLRGIEANGWIVRAKHPENDRILLAELTPAGKRILDRSRASLGGIYQDMLRDFSGRDIAALETLLSRCAVNLESRHPPANTGTAGSPQ
jgi:MarR family transcriptional regulator, organic hydroperoxide resistance regulator